MVAKSEAVEVFRQFAWSLAGKLAAPESARQVPRPPARRQPAPKGRR